MTCIYLSEPATRGEDLVLLVEVDNLMQGHGEVHHEGAAGVLHRSHRLPRIFSFWEKIKDNLPARSLREDIW